MSTGTWMEAWTIPGTTLGSPPVKKIAFIPATSYSWSDPVSEVGRGSMSVPAAYERLAEILDPATNVYSMIRVKRPNGSFGGERITSWLARRFEDRDSDKEYDLAHIGGDSILGLLQVGILPYDYPDVDAKGRSVDPNWQWGSEDEAVGFEDRTGDLENWGFELGSTQHWYESTAGDLVNAPTSFKAIEGAGADTGLWYGEFTGLNNCWVGRRFTTLHASRYNTAVRVKAATGVDYRVRSGPASAVFTGTLLSDFVAYKDGVGDGTYQTVNLEYDAYHVDGDVDIPPFTPGESWVEVVNIDGAVATIQIDEAGIGTNLGPITGNGIGADDWRTVGETLVFATRTFAHTGEWSLVFFPGVDKTIAESHWAYRVFDVTPNVTYTMELWVYHEEVANRNFRVVLTGVGTTVADAFGDSGIISVAPSTWTRIIATGKSPMSRLEARFYYWETAAPTTETFMDDDLFYQGQGPMSWTDIIDQLLDDLSLNHVGVGFERLAFVKHDSYTSTLDSDGTILTPATVTYRAEVGKNIIEVLEDGRDNWGFEFDLIDLETPIGTTYVELKIWNAGGMGTDYSLGAPPPSTPAIVTGTNVQPTEVVKSMPVNDLTFQGDNGLIVREVDDALIDAAGALGTYDNNPEVLTIAAAQAAATQSLGQASQMFGIKTFLVESEVHTTPYYHFLKGDKLRVTLPPAHPSAFRRAMSITGSVDEEDQAQFEVDWDKLVFASNPMRALARAVDRLWKKFDGREQKQLPISVRAATQALTFKGGEMTVTIAASNASSYSKARADFTCKGTDDHLVLSEVNTLIHSRGANEGGKIRLSEGQFNILTAQVVLGEDIWLEGSIDTVIATTSTSGIMVNMSGDSKISNLTLLGPGGVNTVIGVRFGSNKTVADTVHFASMSEGIDLQGNEARIINCSGNLNPLFVDGGAGVEAVTIANCTNVGSIILGQDDWTLTNLVMTGQIIASAGGATGLTIDGISFKGPSGTGTALIDGIAGTRTGFYIGGIICNDALGLDGISLDTWSQGTIGPVHIDRPATGIVLDTCTEVQIIGGEIGGSYLGEHGIHMIGCFNCKAFGTIIRQPGKDTHNTFDGVHVSTGDRCDIRNVTVLAFATTGNLPRSAINIASGTNHVYLGNDAYVATRFATAPYINAGTATINTWPGAAAPQGDNLQT